MTARNRSEQNIQEPTTEAQADATEAQATEPAREYVEYLGEDKYGTEFVDARVISRKDAKDGWDISIPKDLRWTKDGKGRMRLPLSDIPEEVRENLLEDKAFKLVTEE